MLTREQNDALTSVTPETPMGELLRRYWYPVGATAALATHPVQAVSLLGEALVLYRDLRGQCGLLAAACVHRGASLASGAVEDAGLRCASHGWLYDDDGRCLAQPLEPADRTILAGARTTAYPVQELGGLVFAYLGPEPRPLLPRYDVLVWDDAVRETDGTVVPCNWLQVMENLLDPMHVESLHGRYFAYVLERKGGDQIQEFLARYSPAPMQKIGFDLFEQGIIERHVLKSEQDVSWATGTPSFFPTTSLLGSAGQGGSVIFVVPLDDTHTWFVLQLARRTGRPVTQQSIPFFDVPGVDPGGAFITDTANGQDHMAVVTQGAIARREVEHLGQSDLGIVLYRELLVEQLERLERGDDPMNVYRDPAQNQIIHGPGPARTAASLDMTGWSRQRKRWAARQTWSAQTRPDLSPVARRTAAGPRARPEPPALPPAPLRAHREVALH